MNADYETSVAAHKAVCAAIPPAHRMHRRAANWTGNPRFDFLEIAATNDGLHCDVAATSRRIATG
jgi:hypothetical protein